MACGRSSQTLQAYNASIGWEADGGVDARLRRTRVAAVLSGRRFWSAGRHTGEMSSTRRGNQVKARANRDLRLRLVDQRRRGGAARRLVPLRPHRVDMKRHQLRGRRRRGGGWGGSLPRLRVARVETISIGAGAEDSAGKEAGSTIGSGRGWGGAGSGGGGAVVRPHSVHTCCMRCQPRTRHRWRCSSC